MTSPVLVVGAGPTGLTLACDLARRGAPVRLVEQSTMHAVGSRAKGVQPRSLEVFDDLGVVDAVLAAGERRMRFRRFHGSQVLGEHETCPDRAPTPGIPYECGLLVPQWAVERILRERLASLGGRVELGTSLSHFTQDADGVRATLTGAGGVEEARASYLVGCDGGRSTVRKALGIAFVGETRETEQAAIADVRVDGLERDAWHMWLDPERGVGVMLCPLPGTDAWQFQGAADAAEGETGGGAASRTYRPPTLETLQRTFDRYAGMPGVRLRDATWLSTYRVNVRMAERFRADRVFLAGDAAHVHSIAGGLGMNTGIQDAYNLGWKLALVLAGDAAPALLDSYEAERIPIAAWTLSVSSERQRAVIAAARAMDGGVDAGLTKDTTQLGLHYRRSALAGGGGTAGALQPGDRAPDARCRTRDGVETRLFDAFRGPHATLIGFGARTASPLADIGRAQGARVRACAILQPGEALPADAPATLVDVRTEAADCYGRSDGDLVLVRPDGYVAAIDHDAEPRRITRWLAALTTDASLASTTVGTTSRAATA
jgi:2-polyprenyl-6-methoxyphenol hydroxylase-like FAD-dependent oxidoreductase